MNQPFSFAGSEDRYDGRTVTLMARNTGREVPEDAIVVHLNQVRAWGNTTRCDELFIVANDSSFCTASRAFARLGENKPLEAALRCPKVRVRKMGFSEEKIRAVFKPVSSAVSIISSDAPITMTTGLFAALFYRARGAKVMLFGFSEDRDYHGVPCFHTPSVELERELFRSFSDFYPPAQ